MDRRSDILANRNMAYLRQFPNVTMTQHIAFYTEEAVKSMAESGIVNGEMPEKQDNLTLDLAKIIYKESATRKTCDRDSF